MANKAISKIKKASSARNEWEKLSQEAGELLRVWRTSKGISLRSFSRQLGISATHLSHLERGKRRWGNEMLAKLAMYSDLTKHE